MCPRIFFHQFQKRHGHSFDITRCSSRRGWGQGSWNPLSKVKYGWRKATSKLGDLSDEAEEKMHRKWEKIKKLNEVDPEGTFNIHWNGNIDGIPHLMPLPGIDTAALAPQLKFDNLHVKLNVDMYFGFTAQIISREDFNVLDGDSEDEKLGSFVDTHISHAYIGLETKEDITVGHQMNIYLPGEYEYFCSYVLLPEPMFMGCVHVAILDKIPKIFRPHPLNFDDQKFERARNGEFGPGLKAWQAEGMKMFMTNGVGVWM